MTFDHDFGYSFPFIFPPKKRGQKKMRMESKNLDRKSCLSARSFSTNQNAEASINLSQFSGCSYKKEQVVRSYPPSMIQLLLLATKTNERKQVTRF